MKGYILFVKKFRLPLFILLVAITILSIVGITRINISSDFRVFMPEESVHQDKLAQMDAMFESSDQIILMIPLENGYDKTAYDKLNDLDHYLSSEKEVIRFLSPAPDSIDMAGNTITIDSSSPNDLIRLQTYLDLMGEMSPLIESDGDMYATFTIFITESYAASNVHAMEDRLDTLELDYYATGDNYMQFLIFDYLLTILRFIPPIALFFVLLIFAIQLQSIKATLLAILPAALGALTTLGFVGWIGKEVSIVTVLAPIFTIVIGSADGLHFVSHVQDEERNGNDNINSLVKTLSVVGLPMVITTITSMVGFLALLTMNTAAIWDLAVYASVGILFAGLITWYVLPLILVGKIRLKSSSKMRPITFNFLKKLWGVPSYVFILVIILIFGFGVTRIQTEFNMLMVYKESTEIYQSAEKIQEINKGAIPLFLYMETEESPIAPEYAELFKTLSEELNEQDFIGKVVTPYQIIEQLVGIMMPGMEGYPTQPKVLKQMESMLGQQADTTISNLINFDEKAVKAVVFPSDLNNDTLESLESFIDDFNKEHGYTIEVTGIQYLMTELNSSMFSNQISSTTVALFIVFLLLVLSLRKFMPSLISLIPIILTILFLFGFLGLTGISLNIMTTTIFSITVGVGIDYAIHFTSVFIHLKKEGVQGQELLDRTYAYTARPIIANAFGLSFGLSALFISPLAIHMYVALLMWVTMVSSVLFSLVYLPTFLKKLA